MESFLLTTTTSNPLMGQNPSLSLVPSSFSSTLNNRVKIRRIEKVTTKGTSSIVASVSKQGTGKGSHNVVEENFVAAVATTEDIPEVSWKDLQYAAGSTGHRKPFPTKVDKEKQTEYLRKILSSKVHDVAVETPLKLAPLLSAQLGSNNLWLKREDSQQMFSFKIRGAYNMISRLPQEQLNKGIITASAGNHAQGVALSAKRLNAKAHIVLPKTTPQIKIDAVKRLGGIIDLYGNTLAEAVTRAIQRSQEEELTLISSNNEDVIAGQGTVGMEIARQMKAELHAIFVPVGSGSLISGVASFYKLVHPEVKIFGVEPNDENSMAQALNRGEMVKVTDIGHFADGVALQQPFSETYRICNELVDDIILVNKELISAAIKDMFNDTRSILEPSGALSIAAAKAYCKYNKITGKNIVAVTSGGNIIFDQLREISDLANIDQFIIATRLPEKPGSLKKLAQLISELGINITEMTYRFTAGTEEAVVVYKVKAVGSELESLMKKLNSSGFQTYNLSDNPVVRDHLRYMMGGRVKVENETLFRFTFPEMQGALKHFLEDFQLNWNISLFHYCQQGTISSNVLVGVQLEEPEEKNFHDYLRKVGYKYDVISSDDSAHILSKL